MECWVLTRYFSLPPFHLFHRFPTYMRALKNYFTLSDDTDFKKMIPQIFYIYQYISNLCNRFLINVIRDFWTFSEISIFSIDYFALVILQ
ncbi:MAG: hypothetical protein A2157_11220 [Deltaproteobacteria bacterium RBG_16_47_11]|nr:MAG: hypothetical protein A2157_11220 [Deltaproteobacteria bacterium RBG_16_47_11]